MARVPEPGAQAGQDGEPVVQIMGVKAFEAGLDIGAVIDRRDPVAAALWRAHVARMTAQLGRLRVGLPSPRVAALDPRAVRALVLLGVVATFFMAPGDHLRRIGAA